ncbi:hypothetical protein GE061_008828 [Apolygus lucorum]|uniref:Uncharacterized protein n=1 Tax=Apolygus lucorum TaxID=248454 RepID=A0A8S9WNW4_APOLU|nr:hypothetical protein GE061_008828 [Apolygus lucorum]
MASTEWGVIRKFPVIEKTFIGNDLKQAALIVFYVDVGFQTIYAAWAFLLILLLQDVIPNNEFSYEIIVNGEWYVSQVVQIMVSVGVVMVDVAFLFLVIKRGEFRQLSVWLKISVVLFWFLLILTVAALLNYVFNLMNLESGKGAEITFFYFRNGVFKFVRIVWDFYAITVVKNYYFSEKYGPTSVA